MWALLAGGNCFFDLPPLEPGPSAGGAAGFTGIGGSIPTAGSGPDLGGSDAGGSAGGSSSCGEAEKLCDDGQCRPRTEAFGCSSESCGACPSVPGAIVGCIEGQCAVLGCEPGLADCNGDVIQDRGEITGDGCEYSLGLPAPSVESLSVPFAHIQIDGSREDWGAVPAYPFEQLCPNCRDDNTPPITADSSVPPREDLDASFRVAWDGDFFYVLLEAFDNHPFDAGAVGGQCQSGAECEDSLQVFFDGLDNRLDNPEAGYGNDDHRVFLGLSGRLGAPAQAQPASEDVEVVRSLQGTSCYRIEAQFDWKYITGTRGGASAPGQFPPAPGQSYGFDIAVNDWDPSASDDTVIQRQSQLFWVNPGDDYAFRTGGFGPMVLVGVGSDAGL